MRTILLFLLLAMNATAQRFPVSRFSLLVREHFSLTDAQVNNIQRQNDEYFRWSRTKYERMSEVQREIALETARQPIDAMALGVRYVELELTRREIAERDAKLVPENVAQLTEAQKAKLKTLEEAIRLAETVGTAARGERLIQVSCSSGFGDFLVGSISFFNVPNGSCGFRTISPFFP